MSFSTTAAVLKAPGGMTVETIEFESPNIGQISVRMAASGICHTDLHIHDSEDGWGREFPLLLGHEGSGVVEKVGPGVANLFPGDRVAIACRVPCGVCPLCRRGDARRCSASAPAPATIRTASRGAVVTPALGVGLFAEVVVVDARAVVPMPPWMPLDQAAILGCALMTGFGAVANTASVFPGAKVAVIGCGGIGLSAVQGARVAGAGQIVAIDVAKKKLEWATTMGATDTVDSSSEDPVAAVLEITEGLGVDFAFEAVGSPACVDQCLQMLAIGGVATVIGVPKPGTTLEILLGGRQGFLARTSSLLVSHGGDSLPQNDLLTLCRLAEQGLLDVERMITHRVGLDEIDQGFQLMRDGRSIRTIVEFGLSASSDG